MLEYYTTLRHLTAYEKPENYIKMFRKCLYEYLVKYQVSAVISFRIKIKQNRFFSKTIAYI